MPYLKVHSSSLCMKIMSNSEDADPQKMFENPDAKNLQEEFWIFSTFQDHSDEKRIRMHH